MVRSQSKPQRSVMAETMAPFAFAVSLHESRRVVLSLSHPCLLRGRCPAAGASRTTCARCYAASKSCDEISDCATTKTNVVMVVLGLAMLVCVGFTIKKFCSCSRLKEKQEKEAEKAKQAAEAVAESEAEDDAVTVAVVNPAAGAGVAQTQARPSGRRPLPAWHTRRRHALKLRLRHTRWRGTPVTHTDRIMIVV